MKVVWSETLPQRPDSKRTDVRRTVTLPARLTWKDQRGIPRFASVVTRNVSECGVYVECPLTVEIPLFRLVQFQLERGTGDPELPPALKKGPILSAVYRVSRGSASGPQCLALRLMVDPRRRAAETVEPARATA